MGIVSFCPNGHRLNVKASFAGKKGVCPTCGARFRIPASADAPAAIAPDLPTAQLLDVDPAVIATLPRALPFDAAPVVEAGPMTTPASPAEPAPTPAEAPQPALHPMLAERPDLQWCIAFPGGAPTEPLPAESMQAWLDSGQAEGTEVVWRSDWPEWRPARDVFPDHVA